MSVLAVHLRNRLHPVSWTVSISRIHRCCVLHVLAPLHMCPLLTAALFRFADGVRYYYLYQVTALPNFLLRLLLPAVILAHQPSLIRRCGTRARAHAPRAGGGGGLSRGGDVGVDVTIIRGRDRYGGTWPSFGDVIGTEGRGHHSGT